MELVLKSAINGLDDLRAPGMLKLFLLCVLITATAAVVVFIIGLALVDNYVLAMLPTEEELPSGFLYTAIKFGIWLLASAVMIVPIFMSFWSLMIFIASFFDEYIAEKIERFRYPQLAIGQPQPFWREFRQDVLFTVKMVFINLFILLIPIFWPFLWLIFPLVNGYLLGVYFFRMAGGRHIGRKAAGELAKCHRSEILLAGLLIVFASALPVVNLIVPFWGVAMMVHLYHAIDSKHTDAELLPPDGTR